jgi:hypothetical protein
MQWVLHHSVFHLWYQNRPMLHDRGNRCYGNRCHFNIITQIVPKLNIHIIWDLRPNVNTIGLKLATKNIDFHCLERTSNQGQIRVFHFMLNITFICFTNESDLSGQCRDQTRLSPFVCCSNMLTFNTVMFSYRLADTQTDTQKPNTHNLVPHLGWNW